MSVAGARRVLPPWRQRLDESRFGRWWAASAIARFIRRYWWLYLIYRIFKWPVIFALAYLLGARAPWLQDMISKHGPGPLPLAGTAGTTGEKAMDTASMAEHGVRVGDAAPGFTLPLYEAGKEVRDFSLSEARGRTVVLYFYPQDDTPGCTKQACGLRDAHADYAKLNALILGVSQDDAQSHADFAAKFALPFGLLIDSGGELRRRYGNPDDNGEPISRITYIIDGEGKVRHIVGRDADVDTHLAESRAWAEKLSAPQ